MGTRPVSYTHLDVYKRQALYYGMNALSHNVIMADRTQLKSANGMYLGSTGSGKSFAAKRELLNVFRTIPQDRIIVVDPMGEYAPLVRRLGGHDDIVRKCVHAIVEGLPRHAELPCHKGDKDGCGEMCIRDRECNYPAVFYQLRRSPLALLG